MGALDEHAVAADAYVKIYHVLLIVRITLAAI
ncbi:hypothetical protein D1AOALGA4SA_7920 [Olavius algarvensis Delta 1 endosymbiont]|nr:hypothetical protein D1AOALGA4SA_7920 [Olavius algarvensis Delta 1 endosymbiont]